MPHLQLIECNETDASFMIMKRKDQTFLFTRVSSMPHLQLIECNETDASFMIMKRKDQTFS